MHNAAFADQMERWGQLTGGVALLPQREALPERKRIPQTAAGGGTAPPAVEASQPAMRIIPIWMRVPPESGGAPQTRGEVVCAASAE
jgi:hypothetical protein